MPLRLTSSAFRSGDWVPTRHTCEGVNVSPPLEWRGQPEDTQSLALIFDAPDLEVRPWVHWILYNIPPDWDGVPEDFDAGRLSEAGGAQGRNDFSSTLYEGPCPPAGRSYDYYFRLYALDRRLDLPAGATRDQLLDAMRDHILAQTELLLRYAVDEERVADTLRTAGGEG